MLNIPYKNGKLSFVPIERSRLRNSRSSELVRSTRAIFQLRSRKNVSCAIHFVNMTIYA